MELSLSYFVRAKLLFRFLLVFISIFCFCNLSFAQIKRNSIYAEIGGNAGIYSVNYDKLFDVNDKLKFAPRVGFSTLGDEWFAVPIEANLLWSKKENARHFAEFGLGTTYILSYSYKWRFADKSGITFIDVDEEKAYRSRLLLVGRFGYRYQKPQGGFMYRLGVNFLYTSKHSFNPFPIPGISLGYSF